MKCLSDATFCFNKIIQKFWELPLYAVVGGAVALFDLVFFMILVDVFGYPFLLVNFLGFFWELLLIIIFVSVYF